MQEILSHRLPKFTNKEVKMVKGSIDFVGVNQYTAYYMYDARQGKPKVLGYQQDWNASFACVDDPGNVTLAKGLHDTTRINYYKAYSTQLKRAIDDGANVEGYFAWSLLDNFEWRLGYTSSCSLMFALGMFCCWEAAYVSSVVVSGVLIMSLPCCLGKLLTFHPLPSLEC